MRSHHNVVFMLLAASHLTGCGTLTVKPFAGTTPNPPGPAPKVALVGFATYSGRVTRVVSEYSYVRTDFVATVSPGEHLKKECSIGRPLESIIAGPAKGIPVTDASAFVERYRQVVRALDADGEISAILVQRAAVSTNAVARWENAMWSRDVDYYVVASFSPPFFKGGKYSPKRALTDLLSGFTLFTIPQTLDGEKQARFDVYDGNLRLLKTFDYTGSYEISVAWWSSTTDNDSDRWLFISNGRKARMTPSRVWIPDIRRFECDFLAWLMVKDEQPQATSSAHEGDGTPSAVHVDTPDRLLGPQQHDE